MQNKKIKLIVGLGNPGSEYEHTRHNAGADFVQAFTNHIGGQLKLETKFKGRHFHYKEDGNNTHLLIPSTYMNNSGQSVKAIAQFYKIPIEGILVAHDELDLPPGTIRIKQAGGHGGHNGLRDIINHMASPNFVRLRIGIGHPGDRNRVTQFVLSKATKAEDHEITNSIDDALRHMPDILDGNLSKTMQSLHTKQNEQETVKQTTL